MVSKQKESMKLGKGLLFYNVRYLYKKKHQLTWWGEPYHK